MAQCYCCGKMLINPESILTGLGPMCEAGKCKCGVDKEAAENRKLAQTPVGDKKKEADIIKYLHKRKITVKFANNHLNAEKQERQLKKQDYLWIKDFAYHSYGYIPQRLDNNKDRELLVLAHDSLYKEADGTEHTEMVVSLWGKLRPEAQKENGLEVTW